MDILKVRANARTLSNGGWDHIDMNGKAHKKGPSNFRGVPCVTPLKYETGQTFYKTNRI